MIGNIFEGIEICGVMLVGKMVLATGASLGR